jgi:hypothetical protein
LILVLVALFALVRWTPGLPPLRQKLDHNIETSAPSRSHVSLANFRRIERGMSVAQVEVIFGIPGEGGIGGQGERSWSWREGPNVVQASFRDDDGKATCAYSFVFRQTTALAAKG